jgi:hypothetical protein
MEISSRFKFGMAVLRFSVMGEARDVRENDETMWCNGKASKDLKVTMEGNALHSSLRKLVEDFMRRKKGISLSSCSSMLSRRRPIFCLHPVYSGIRIVIIIVLVNIHIFNSSLHIIIHTEIIRALL